MNKHKKNNENNEKHIDIEIYYYYYDDDHQLAPDLLAFYLKQSIGMPPQSWYFHIQTDVRNIKAFYSICCMEENVIVKPIFFDNGGRTMKRIGVIISILALCLSITSSVFAVGDVSFSYSGNGTKNYVRASDTTQSEEDTWKMIDWVSLTAVKNKRCPEVRIFHAPGVYASSHFYYYTKSEKPHAYNPVYCNGEDVYVGCRKHGTQSGNVEATATFDP